MYAVFLCYYTSYLRSNWGKSWQDRKGSLLCSWVQQNCSTDMVMARLRVEDAGRGTDGCWMASCLVLLVWFFLSDSCNFLGCEIMQTEIHPAIKFCCLGVWVFFFLLFWVPLIWSAFKRPRSTSAPPDRGKQQHWPLASPSNHRRKSARAAALLSYPVRIPTLALKKNISTSATAESWLSHEDTMKTGSGDVWVLVIEKKKCLDLARDVSVALFTAAARTLGKR